MESTEVPKGSKIKMETSSRGDVSYYWNKSDGGIGKYFISLFLIAWLGGWSVGLKSVLTQLITTPNSPQNLFLIFWLAGWSLGGCAAIWFLIQIIRPQKPEKIIFHSNGLDYDTGTFSPLAAMFSRSYFANPFELWKKILQKRKIFSGLRTDEIKFVHEKNPSRVYFDWESKRYEVGTGLSEPDIDWLYSQLGKWSK